MLFTEAAKDVVLAEKPVISGTRDSLDPTLLNELLSELGTLASVYHKPANTFVSKARMAVQKAEDLEQARKAEQQQQIDDSGRKFHDCCCCFSFSACIHII